MITQIHAKNFKSWKDTGDLRLAPLTGLFGTNNSGKTSILQMLLLMKQTVESKDQGQVLRTGDDISLIDLGTFSDIIHGHQLDASLRLSFSWKLTKSLFVKEPEKPAREIRELSFTALIGEDSDRVEVEYFVYEFDKYTSGMSRTTELGKPGPYELTRRGFPTTEPVYLQSPPVSCYGFPDEVKQYRDAGFLLGFAPAFKEMFSRIKYLGSLREYPRRSYPWVGEHPDGVGVQGGQVLSTLLAARVEGPNGIRNEQRIRKWLQQMGLIHSFDPKRIATGANNYEIGVRTSETSPEVLITDVGSGVPQVLPVLVQCYYAPENSIILLEQPESHLHPSAQAGLADVLMDVVKDKERNVQIIVESHSEHLLRRIQRRIAEEKISQDMVALYFCRMENGQSKIEELDVDEFGNIRNWPQNFFGDGMGELVAMTEAEMKRKKKAAHNGSG